MRLSAQLQDRLPPEVARPSYDRDGQKVGIVHLGMGAFHRAHQAWYTDQCLERGDSDWLIAGVSLRSPNVAAQLNPQDGLYTVTERGAETEMRLIGAVREVLVAGCHDAKIAASLNASTTHVVSLTVTEKGYHRRPDGSLDLEAAKKQSIYTYLAQALRDRKRGGISGLTLLSCDNLMHNGDQLAQLLRSFFEVEAPDVLGWFEHECACPNSMVDRIVPATTEADIDRLEREIEVRDEGAVFTERFSQWVIEDRFAGPRPSWEKHGAQVVADVAPYETAKLRMLNGAHSTLAYLGLARGHTFVHEAITDPPLRALTTRLMRNEAAPTIDIAVGQDLRAYADRLIERFEDQALQHRLTQIAMDGSQKIHQRWLETLAWHSERRRDCPSLLTAIAGWIRHLSGEAGPIEDPRSVELSSVVNRASAEGAVAAIFGPGGLMSSAWIPCSADIEMVDQILAGLPDLPEFD